MGFNIDKGYVPRSVPAASCGWRHRLSTMLSRELTSEKAYLVYSNRSCSMEY